MSETVYRSMGNTILQLNRDNARVGERGGRKSRQGEDRGVKLDPILLLFVPLRLAEADPGLLGLLLPVHEPDDVRRAQTGQGEREREAEPEACGARCQRARVRRQASLPIPFSPSLGPTKATEMPTGRPRT